ncbi:hypothetical protein KQX54_011938 [Cotesia glomerata]|uniref:Uncharacterized protein n=1 Tax=Cotesia glomerata TaxID=32391 RepID=A0AAV7IEG2_COTGL|nr:hypothetical protein KQX54_011938 [Cotesia glomerata]
MSRSRSSVSSEGSDSFYEWDWVSDSDPIFYIYNSGFELEDYNWVLKIAPERQPINCGQRLTFLQWFLLKFPDEAFILLSTAPAATQVSLGKVFKRVYTRRTLSFDNWCWQEPGPEIDLLFGRDDGLEEPS